MFSGTLACQHRSSAEETVCRQYCTHLMVLMFAQKTCLLHSVREYSGKELVKGLNYCESLSHVAYALCGSTSVLQQGFLCRVFDIVIRV